MSRSRRRKGRNVSGIVVLDKAKGLSSNAALQEVKRIYGANKAGHTGSLDPLATGVLPICLGEATKVSQYLLESDKKYRARLKLGIRTDSADSEGIVTERCEDFVVKAEDVEKALQSFRGEIEQIPPMHSALKVDGVPLYKLARKGQTVARVPRKITVYRIAKRSPSFIRPMAMPATGAFTGTPASIIARLLPQTLAMELEPLDSVISDTTRMA